MSLPESLNKPVAKVALVIVVIAAVGTAVYEMSTSSAFRSNDYGKQVSPQFAAAQAQKAIEALKANTSIPPAAKEKQIQHLQGEVDAANGQAAKASGPPAAPPSG